MGFWDKSVGGKLVEKAEKSEEQTDDEKRISDLTAEVDRLRRACHTLEEQNAAYRTIEQDSQELVAQLRRDYANIKPYYDRYVACYGELTEPVKLMAEEPQAGETEESEAYQMRARLRAMSDRCFELQEELKRFKQEDAAEDAVATAAQQKEVSELKAQLTSKQKQIAKLETSRTALQQENKRLSQHLKDAQRTFTLLRQRVAEHLEGNSAGARKGTAEEELQRRDAQINELTTNVTKLNEDNTALVQERQDLMTQLQGVNSELDEMQIKYDALLEQLTVAKRDIQQLQDRCAAAEADKQQQQDKVKQLQETVQQRDERLEDYDRVFMELKTTLNTLERTE